MIFQHFFLLEANESNLYVVGCEETREAALIDAGAFDRRVVDFVRRKGLRIVAALATHSHWDHTGGLAQYQKEFGCKALGAEQLSEGQAVQAGRLRLQTLRTSGHTDDSVSFHVAEEGVVFTGDALFAGSVGGASSAKHQAEEIANIRAKILSLPEDTLICPGHGPASTVGTEKTRNPFLA